MIGGEGNGESRSEYLLAGERLCLVEYVSEGIYGNTVEENLVVEMRACGSAGLSDFADDLPSFDAITFVDPELM